MSTLIHQIEFRASEEDYELIQQVTAEVGLAVSDYVRSRTLDQARRELAERRTIGISTEHADAFYAALDDDTPGAGAATARQGGRTRPVLTRLSCAFELLGDSHRVDGFSCGNQHRTGGWSTMASPTVGAAHHADSCRGVVGLEQIGEPAAPAQSDSDAIR